MHIPVNYSCAHKHRSIRQKIRFQQVQKHQVNAELEWLLGHSVLHLPAHGSKSTYRACNLEMFYEQFTQNRLNKYNHALKTSLSTKCIFCSLPAACIWSVHPTAPTIPQKEHNPEGQPSSKSWSSDPFPGIWTGTLPCRSVPQTGCTAIPTQPTEKSFLCTTGSTTNHCTNSSQRNFKFYLNSRTASLPNITFTVYNATVSSILREHQYFRTLSQCVYFYFKTYPPNSKTTFKTAS